MERCAYFSQPRTAEASTESTGTPSGKTLSWYSRGCSSKSSWHGIETMLTCTSPIAALASTAICTSEPVATITSSAAVLALSSTYAPLATASTELLAWFGMPWRDSASTEGASALATAHAKEPDTSLPSQGLKTYMLGMARRDSSISTGWWVGPSSPRPMESWVMT